MNEKLLKLGDFFRSQIDLCAQRAAALSAGGRADEAVFEKVRGNIYDVFRTVLSAAVQACGEDPDAVERFFAERLEKIPQSWEAAREKAMAHNDTEKVFLEEIKLETVSRIRETFTAIWEDET